MSVYNLYESNYRIWGFGVMNNKIKERIKYWAQLFLVPVYGLSFLMPRNKKIWLFGSTFGRRFADSPRYLFLYLSEYSEDIRPVWITDNEEIYNCITTAGYEACMRGTFKSFLLRLRGGVYFYDNYPKDISHWLSGGAVKINLWHGVPLKKIQHDNVMDKFRHPKNMWERWKTFPRRLSDEKKSHYILATSEYYRPIFESAFQTKRTIVNRYPRTDIFTCDEIANVLLEDEKKSLEEIHEKSELHDKVFIYMPTFRDSENVFFDCVNLKRLNDFLAENKYLLAVKLHCKSKLKEAFETLESPHICVIEPAADPSLFLGLSDALITDYSSVYFDYLLTDKPEIFFSYDLSEYLEKSREMYFDFDEFTPGPKCMNQDELEVCMKSAFESSSKYSEKRAEIREKAFVNQGNCASEELITKVRKIVKI